MAAVAEEEAATTPSMEAEELAGASEAEGATKQVEG